MSDTNMVEQVKKSLELALKGESKLPKEVYTNAGKFRTPSSSKIRHLQNNLCDFEGVRYLEIGTYMGTSIISSSYENEGYFVSMDNWSEFLKHGKSKAKPVFLSNRERYKEKSKFEFYECNCWEFDKNNLKHKINVYYYDGCHDYEDTMKGFTYFDDILEDEFIFMVDDWNLTRVRRATNKVFKELKYEILFSKEYTKEPRTDWWNGIYFGVIKKNV